jgi:hypothetical protein
MDGAYFAAVTATVGVIVSAIVAFLVGRNQARTELAKANLENRRVFLEKLYEVRLRTYPGLYSILGGLGGRVLSKQATVANVQSAWAAVQEWDLENALYLSPHTARCVIGLRRMLSEMSELNDSDFSRTKQRRDLMPQLVEIQMCLKTELGVLDADGFHNPARIRTLREAVDQAAALPDL